MGRNRGLVVAVRHHQGRTWRQRMRRAAPTYGSRRMPGRTACPISDTSRLHVSRVIGAIADDDVRAPISRASCRFAETRMSGCSRSRRRGANASQSFEKRSHFRSYLGYRDIRSHGHSSLRYWRHLIVKRKSAISSRYASKWSVRDRRGNSTIVSLCIDRLACSSRGTPPAGAARWQLRRSNSPASHRNRP